jgi:hypothetical protein
MGYRDEIEKYALLSAEGTKKCYRHFLVPIEGGNHA